MSRHALFDLAVERALSYALRLKLLPENDPQVLHQGLELWYLKTRFAYRISLADIITVLQSYPGQGYRWQGGRQGGWIEPDPFALSD